MKNAYTELMWEYYRKNKKKIKHTTKHKKNTPIKRMNMEQNLLLYLKV